MSLDVTRARRLVRRMSRLPGDLRTYRREWSRSVSLRDGLRLIDSFRHSGMPGMGSSYTVSLPTVAVGYRFAVEAGTTDANEVRDVVVERSHLPAWLHDARAILDAGAGTGLTTADYLNRFPRATVVAVEPQAALERRIREVCAPWRDRLVVVPCALWDTDDEVLELGVRTSYSVGAALTTVRAASNAPSDYQMQKVRTVSLARLCDEHGPFDLAKIDVEGAETAVLADAGRWAAKIDSLIVELHPGRTGMGVDEASALLEAAGYVVEADLAHPRRPVLRATRRIRTGGA